jgi:single-strand DNA-binding protein
MVAAMGRIHWGEYKSRIGELRESWTLLADSIVTAKSAKPGAARRAPAAGPATKAATTRLDDQVPF